MFMTGAQNVESACPTFMKARASRPITLPVAAHRLRLNAQLAVIGKTVFDDHGVGALLLTPWMPWVASDHQLWGGRLMLGKGRSLFMTLSALILSAVLSRETMSAARASRLSRGSHTGHVDGGADEHQAEGTIAEASGARDKSESAAVRAARERAIATSRR